MKKLRLIIILNLLLVDSLFSKNVGLPKFLSVFKERGNLKFAADYRSWKQESDRLESHAAEFNSHQEKIRQLKTKIRRDAFNRLTISNPALRHIGERYRASSVSEGDEIINRFVSDRSNAEYIRQLETSEFTHEKRKDLERQESEFAKFREESRTTEEDVERFKLQSLRMNNKSFGYTREQFAIATGRGKVIYPGRDIMNENASYKTLAVDCNKISDLERKIECYGDISRKFTEAKIKLRNSIKGDQRQNKLLERFLSADNDELFSASNAYVVLKKLEEQGGKCLSGLNSMGSTAGESNCMILINGILSENNLSQFNLKDADDFKKFIKDLRNVGDFLSQGTVSQFISRSCMREVIKVNEPNIGEVITNPNSSKVSVSSYLGAFQTAYGRSLNEGTGCPKERYLFPYQNNRSEGYARRNFPDSYVPQISSYKNRRELLDDIEYDPTLAPTVSEDEKIDNQIILQSLSCPKSDCLRSCRGAGTGMVGCVKMCQDLDKGEAGRIRRVKCRKREYEDRPYKKCEESSINRSSEDTCTECAEVAGFDRNVIDLLNGSRALHKRAVASLEDPNNMSTFHYKFLLRAIGINQAVENFCKVYGVSIRRKDFPASCSDGMYDQVKRGSTRCKEKHPNTDFLASIALKSSAKELAAQIKEINDMEKEYVPEADKIIAELKRIKERPNMCQRDYIKWLPECIAHRFTRTVSVGAAQAFSKAKNYFKATTNDYRRYVRTGDEKFLDKYVNGVGPMLSLNLTSQHRKELRARIIKRVKGATSEKVRRMREKIYEKKKYIQSIIKSNPLLVTGLLGETRVEALGEDGVSFFPSLDKFKLVNRFANDKEDPRKVLEASLEQARQQAKAHLNNICTAPLKKLVADKDINKQALKTFPNVRKMDACIKKQIEDLDSLKTGLTTTFLIAGGVGVCFIGMPACIAGGFATGAVYSGNEVLKSSRRLSDSVNCNVTNGTLSQECSADAMQAIMDEHNLNQFFLGADLAFSFLDIFPVRKVLSASVDLAVKAIGAVDGVRAGMKISKLRRLANQMYEGSRNLIRAELDAVMNTIRSLPYEMRIQFNNRLRKLIANADNVEGLFLLNIRQRFPDVDIPQSYLDDILHLSDAKRTEIMSKVANASSPEDLKLALKELEEIRSVQRRLDAELTPFVARNKYKCMY